ncbi:MAG: T9SS type A sorting domain-containing protein [Moheibacter sp.]
MKTLISLFSIVLCLSYGKAQWVELDPGVDVPSFSDVYAITPDIVVAVGANGIIIKTTDGGETWVQKPSGSTEDLRKVQFPTPDTGYIIGGGTLLKTTDGGETWNSTNVEVSTGFYSLSCVNENLIFISANNGLIKSEDGGSNWTLPTQMPYYQEIQFLSNEIGFVGNDYWSNFENAFAKTNNGSESWIEKNALAPFHFIDESIGFFYFQGLYKTIDGGNQFELVSDFEESIPTFSDIFAINENTIWGILFMEALDGDTSSRGIIKISSTESSPYTEFIWYDNDLEIDMLSIHFADETTGYIAGIKNNKGTIWKNGTGINTMNVTDENLKDKIKIYPNPATNEVNIVIKKSLTDNFTITLTDITGKKVHSKYYQNTDRIAIDVKSLVKGVYILSINSTKQNYTKKIIIN